jgi:hypothetical protein
MKGGPPCGTSWLEADEVSFSFFSFLRVVRVGGSASGRVAGVRRPSASSAVFIFLNKN